MSKSAQQIAKELQDELAALDAEHEGKRLPYLRAIKALLGDQLQAAQPPKKDQYQMFVAALPESPAKIGRIEAVVRSIKEFPKDQFTTSELKLHIQKNYPEAASEMAGSYLPERLKQAIKDGLIKIFAQGQNGSPNTWARVKN
jgi:hypothetical protein